MGPSELDLVSAMKYYHDQQAIIDSPFARAHHYLSKIALFRKENENGLKIGELDFVAPAGPDYCDNCAVFSEDQITAKLLQASLIELGNNTSVEIVDHS